MEKDDVDATSTLPPIESAVVRVARDARDPRMKGIVLSRLFDDEVEPQRIDRFVLLDRLGEGGMGVVYAAYDEQLDRKIAIKVLRPLPTADLSQGSERLLREARAMARLSHPNIVTVHEVGLHDGEVFVAMEYVRGQSLEHWIPSTSDGSTPSDPSTRRSWREVVEVFRVAGRGLEAAHLAGIVHRDFKPHNVVLSEGGEVKVFDFGLARMIESGITPSLVSDDAPSTLTRTGAVMGTPAYMAPEQHDGAPADALCDQFSFFVSLYHVLHGRLPFPTQSIHGFALAAAQGRVLPPDSDSTVPRWLHQILLVGLQPQPGDRYPSMTEALAALGRDRSARRRRWISAGGFTVLVAGASAMAAMSLDSPAPIPCDRGASELEEVWGADARRRLEHGLRASGLPLAEETWERLQPRLDAYADRWIASRDDACAAHRDGSRSAELYDRSVACLERRRAALGSLVELLSVADQTAAERALPAAAALPDLTYCTQTEALLRDIPPPDDPVVAREIEVQRQVLARVREHEALGRYEAGIEQARAVVMVAERLGYRALLAEAYVRLGSLTMEHGAPEDAEHQLTEALTHALASAHFPVAMEALARRIFVRAERSRAPERAVDDVAIGHGLLEHVPDDPRLQGLFFNNVGAYHIRREAYDEARTVLLRALRIKREGIGPDDPELAYTLGNLALVERHEGNDEMARAHLDEALALTERVLGPHHPMTAQVMRLRGEMLLHFGRLGAAREALESVLELLRQTTGPRSPLRHGPLAMLGEIALTERNHADALEWFQRATALDVPIENGGEMYRVLEEVGRARALMGLGQLDDGMATFRRALARAEHAEAPYLSVLMERWGRTLLLHGKPESALPPLERALELERAGGTPVSLATASSQTAMGQALRRLGRLDEARAALDAALSVLDQLGGAHPSERAAILTERAWIATARGDTAAALAHARAAVVAQGSWGEPEHLDRIRVEWTLLMALRAGTPTPAQDREASQLEERIEAAMRRLGARGGPKSHADLIDFAP